MENSNLETKQVESVRKGTINILENLTEKAEVFQLPEAPSALQEYRRKLVENIYQVLVVGEAKRGKSSLVNALIGRPLLPTNVDVATCQVFRVAVARREAYYVRYEDDSTKEITADQLPDYGSQAVIDVKGLAFDQIPRWIEVDLPTVEFLPKGVSILDTPGLGSLYAAHAQITQRFVPQADAVIFVLDSEKPIIKSELEFIEHLLSVTHNIFFVQTKIDQYDDDHWQQIQRRNESILTHQFGDRLDSVQVWPISSCNLLMAAQTGDKDYLEVSYYQQLATALQAFLFRVSGWNRCADALVVASHFHRVSRNALANHVAQLELSSTQKLIDLQQKALERLKQFDAEWGTQGKKSSELKSDIRRAANVSKQNFTQFLGTGGILEKTYWQKIDATKTIEEVNKLGAELDEQMASEVMSRWQVVCEEAHLQCTALLGALIEAADAPSTSVDDQDLNIQISLPDEIKGDVWEKFAQSQSEFLKAGAVSANAVLIALYLFPATVLPLLPIAVPVVVAAGVWAAIRKWKLLEASEVKKGQQDLHDHLSNALKQIRERFLRDDSAYNNQSLVNYYFSSLIESIDNQIQQIAEAKSRESNETDTRLSAEIALDEQERKSKAVLLQQQLTEWDAIGCDVQDMVDRIRVMDKPSIRP